MNNIAIQICKIYIKNPRSNEIDRILLANPNIEEIFNCRIQTGGLFQFYHTVYQTNSLYDVFFSSSFRENQMNRKNHDSYWLKRLILKYKINSEAFIKQIIALGKWSIYPELITIIEPKNPAWKWLRFDERSIILYMHGNYCPFVNGFYKNILTIFLFYRDRVKDHLDRELILKIILYLGEWDEKTREKRDKSKRLDFKTVTSLRIFNSKGKRYDLLNWILIIKHDFELILFLAERGADINTILPNLQLREDILLSRYIIRFLHLGMRIGELKLKIVDRIKGYALRWRKFPQIKRYRNLVESFPFHPDFGHLTVEARDSFERNRENMQNDKNTV